MNTPTILVTGATGKTGATVVAQLREKGWPVRAAVRTIDERSARLERLGAQIVVADLYDPRQLREAMRGTERAYYCPPFEPFMIEAAAAFAVAAREEGLGAIVGLSQWLAGPSHPSLLTRQHWLADQLFSSIPGVAYTIINPGYFADNYLGRMIAMAAQLGVYPVLTGDSRNAPPSNEDIARVAVAVLIDPDGHAGRSYRPTGPALLSAPEMVDIMGRVLGRKIRGVPMPLWLLGKSARRQGGSAFLMSSLRAYLEDHRQGAFAFGAPTGDVLALTGRDPEDFETIVRRYAAMPEARRSLGSVAKAAADFLTLPIAPGYNLDRYERRLGFPVPPEPHYALQDEHWKRDHAAQSARRPVPDIGR